MDFRIIDPKYNFKEDKLEVGIWSTTSDADSPPDKLLYKLKNPENFRSNQINTFTPPTGATITLEPNTTYAIVFSIFQIPAEGAQWIYMAVTLSDDEDSGAASGWSVANTSFSSTRRSLNGPWKAWISSGNNSLVLKMRIKGTAILPRVVSARVSDDILTLTFSEALDTGSVPAASAFTVSVDGFERDVANVDFRADSRFLDLTLSAVDEEGAVVTVGAEVTVGYDRPAANRLRSKLQVGTDIYYSEVASFSPIEAILSRSEQRRQTVEGILAAVGARTLSGALDNIGPRLGEAVPAAGLALAGRSVPFGASGAAARGCPAGGYGRDSGSCAQGVRSRGVAPDEFMGSSAFSWTLGAGEGAAEPGGPQAVRLSVWGRGDYGSFEGRPGPGTRYEGWTRTGWLGMDARAGRWVAGLALSRGTSASSYSLGGDAPDERGRLETGLTALWPYGRWTFANRLELRGIAGAGSGRLTHRPGGDAPREASRLTMRMGSAGLRQALKPLAGFALAWRADASFIRMQTGKGEETVDGLQADVWRGRAGLEASRPFALENGGALAPFLEAALREDGGDGPAGTGVELAGGLRYAAGRLSVEARGRWLAAHTEAGTQERGASLTVRFEPEAGGRGLSLALTPRHGAPAGGADALWREEMPKAGGAAADAGALDLRAGYGFRAAGRGLLTPFAETGFAGGDGRRLRLGTRFDAPRAGLSLELAGERRETAAARPEHIVGLELRIGF